MCRGLLVAFFLFPLCLSAFGCGGNGADQNVVRDPINLGGFCGFSTEAECNADKNCYAGGCSGQLCQNITEMLGTTCEWLDCYRDETYGVKCGCVDGKCQWYKKVPKVE